MSLVHLDIPSGATGLYGTNTSLMLNGTYAEVDLTWTALEDDPDPGITGNVLRFNGGIPDPLIRKVLPSNQTKVGMGRRFWVNTLPSADNNSIVVFDWRNASNTIIAAVYIDTTGRLVLSGGGGADVRSTSPIIVANAWQHIEAVLDTTAGSLSVRVEGFPIVSFTGRTFSGPISQVAVRITIGASTRQYLKDWFIWDGSGTRNNDWMGPIQVFDMTPDGDISNGWTSTGSNAWSVIDESPPNDADYIQAGSSLPAPAVVTLTNLPSNIVAIRGIISFTRSWKTDGGDATLVMGVSPNGTNWDNGSDILVSTAPTYWSRVSELSPATGTAWTPVEINALRLRFNRTV